MMSFLENDVIMLYFITIFLSALLLFLIQPMIAKVILPDFGGGAAVWTIAMLFFQTLLLTGYCYSYALIKWFRPRNQLLIHGVLLLAALIATPLSVGVSVFSFEPQLSILLILLGTVGLPYFVVAANAPLIQAWFAYERPTISPYKLYALSNIGSLLGLLLYPFIIEPFLSLENQLLGWSIVYWLFVGANLVLIALLLRQFKVSAFLQRGKASKHISADAFNWIVLSAFGVVGLLAITNSISQNISSIPFLWLLPLALYLISFIVCFANELLASRRYWLVGLVIALPITFLLYFFASVFPIVVQVILYSFVLLTICMVCHGELARRKPAPERLTSYYLAMSFGGVIGGIFVNFIAPAIFNQFLEFPLIVFLVMTVSIVYAYRRGYSFHQIPFMGLSSCSLVAMLLFLFINHKYQQYDIASDRNFYGQLSVKDIRVGNLNERRLVDGTTSHGTQSLDPMKQRIPQSYYRKMTGVWSAIKALQKHDSLDIVIVGLGAGTLAAYGRESDNIEFLELNPLVKDYAANYFTYLAQSKSLVTVKIGDGRQLLGDNIYDDREIDLLVIDAFSSDAIPVHLLTQEAMALYSNRIANNGMIAIHISNSHLDLVPLVYGLGKIEGLASTFVLTDKDQENNMAQWVLLAKDIELLNADVIKQVQTPWPDTIDKPIVWTDDYSNLLSVLK